MNEELTRRTAGMTDYWEFYSEATKMRNELGLSESSYYSLLQHARTLYLAFFDTRKVVAPPSGGKK